ncbi:MAG: ABC transporter ATP-binding protein [Marinilabiliaceae bacterium]|nr:ABC transporter ATP-binding protein [Marinilabiliaceae bacterium]
MLKVEEMTFSYGSKKIFENLNLEIPEGRICGLLGLNGAGKSTLLYLMSGLLFAKSGRIEFNDIDVMKRSPKVLRDMFLIPEEFELPAMTLKRYVEINAPFYPNFDNEKLQHSLDAFDMKVKDVKLNTLSMGQKKKVFLSFALATNVSLLLMDEPTNGLDIPSKSQFRKAVAQSMREDQTILISTHQIRDIESMLDHIILIDESEVLLNATVGEILDKLLFADYLMRDTPADALYTQASALGQQAVTVKRADEESSDINVELLFNASLEHKDVIRKMFKM